MTQAKEAAGDNNVLVHGTGTAQLALAVGVLDELELHVIPVLFGQGCRLFDHLSPEHIELERTRILEGRPMSPTCTIGFSAEISVAGLYAARAPQDGRRRREDSRTVHGRQLRCAVPDPGPIVLYLKKVGP